MSVIAACLPILGPIIFKKNRVDSSKPSKTSAISSYFRKGSDGKSNRHLGGKYSRAIDSIDRLHTQDESFSMKSLAPIEAFEFKVTKDGKTLYVHNEPAVEAATILK